MGQEEKTQTVRREDIRWPPPTSGAAGGSLRVHWTSEHMACATKGSDHISVPALKYPKRPAQGVPMFLFLDGIFSWGTVNL